MKEKEKSVEELSDAELLAGLMEMVSEVQRLDGEKVALEQLLAERARERSLHRRLHPEHVLAPREGARRKPKKLSTARRR